MYEQLSDSPKRITVDKKIWQESQDGPFIWKDIKNIEFEDNDVIRLEYVEAYYSENNGWDAHFSGSVTRKVPETDEQFEKRQKRAVESKEEMRQRRYETYLKLKKEFESA